MSLEVNQACRCLSHFVTIWILDETVDVRIIKNTLRATTMELIPEISTNEQDWGASIIQKLTHRASSVVTRELKDFVLTNGERSFKGNGGVLAGAISKAKAKEELKRFHDLSCSDTDISVEMLT